MLAPDLSCQPYGSALCPLLWWGLEEWCWRGAGRLHLCFPSQTPPARWNGDSSSRSTAPDHVQLVAGIGWSLIACKPPPATTSPFYPSHEQRTQGQKLGFPPFSTDFHLNLFFQQLSKGQDQILYLACMNADAWQWLYSLLKLLMVCSKLAHIWLRFQFCFLFRVALWSCCKVVSGMRSGHRLEFCANSAVEHQLSRADLHCWVWRTHVWD